MSTSSKDLSLVYQNIEGALPQQETTIPISSGGSTDRWLMARMAFFELNYVSIMFLHSVRSIAWVRIYRTPKTIVDYPAIDSLASPDLKQEGEQYVEQGPLCPYLSLGAPPQRLRYERCIPRQWCEEYISGNKSTQTLK